METVNIIRNENRKHYKDWKQETIQGERKQEKTQGNRKQYNETGNNETKRKLYMNNKNKLLCTVKKDFFDKSLITFFAVSVRKNFLLDLQVLEQLQLCKKCNSAFANIKPGEFMYSPKSHKYTL